MISGEHVASVNMSRSRALVVLRSLHGKRNGPDQRVSLTITTMEIPHHRLIQRKTHLQILLAAGLDATPYRLKDTGAVAFRGFR